ncbi:protein kinase domain-containing protein [Actinomadura vinacea]|uniref:protein kinase domain-containing protein n=1 Tax=Actinomadura vinacea TaxID=115336 RepID=UPI0031D93712
MTTGTGDDGLVPLGTGPTATVYAGVSPAGEAYALKVLPGPLDRRTRGDVEKELARLAALRGQAPILVADRLEEMPDGRHALRMELFPQSMPELIGSFGPLSVPDALALGTAIASAMATAHRSGIVHGGVTPGNVLFRATGEPILADFGVTLRQVFPPDPSEFAAPESIRDGSADQSSDLYGLGGILYLALAGRSPYAGTPGEPPEERVLRALSTSVPRLDRPDLPPGLADLVAGLLAKDPAARPADAASVAGRLTALHAGVTGQNRPAQPGDAFDDFAGATANVPPPLPAQSPPPTPEPPAPSLPAGAPLAQPQPLPLGKPILEFTPEDRPKEERRSPWGPVAIAGFALLAVVAVLLIVNRPEGLADPKTPPRAAQTSKAPTPAPGPDVQIELVEVRDQANSVKLKWTSSRSIDFVVTYATAEETKSLPPTRATESVVKIDPEKAYCFEVMGIDSSGRHWTSAPKPIRKATCQS